MRPTAPRQPGPALRTTAWSARTARLILGVLLAIAPVWHALPGLGHEADHQSPHSLHTSHTDHCTACQLGVQGFLAAPCFAAPVWISIALAPIAVESQLDPTHVHSAVAPRAPPALS